MCYFFPIIICTPIISYCIFIVFLRTRIIAINYIQRTKCLYVSFPVPPPVSSPTYLRFSTAVSVTDIRMELHFDFDDFVFAMFESMVSCIYFLSITLYGSHKKTELQCMYQSVYIHSLCSDVKLTFTFT